MAMASMEFGWELLFASVEPCITKKEDVLIAFIHFTLIKHGFRCYGFDGEENVEIQNGTELLPTNWSSKESLNMKYKLGEQTFVLQVTKSQGKIIFNLLNPDKVEASNVVFEIESSVAELRGPIKSIFPSYTEIWTKVEESLLKTLAPESIKKNTVAVQATKSDEKQPDRETPLNPRPHAERRPDREEYFDPLGVGRSDLDPLGRLGGGMLFQPPGRGRLLPGVGVPGGLARGSVPPGARFDPFGPPDIGRPRRGGGGGGFGPDHDHMTPPGYDDMFM